MPPKRKLEALGAEVSTPKKPRVSSVASIQSDLHYKIAGEYNYHLIAASLRTMFVVGVPSVYRHWTKCLNALPFAIPADCRTAYGHGSLLHDFLGGPIPADKNLLEASNAFFEALIKKDHGRIMISSVRVETPLRLIARLGRSDLAARLLAIHPQLMYSNAPGDHETNPLTISVIHRRREATAAMCSVAMSPLWVQHAFQTACHMKDTTAFAMLTTGFDGWCHPDAVDDYNRTCTDLAAIRFKRRVALDRNGDRIVVKTNSMDDITISAENMRSRGENDSVYA